MSQVMPIYTFIHYFQFCCLQENEFIKQRLARAKVRYIWTSGRKCNFAGCDRPDLQPPNENGWFWSGSGAKIGNISQIRMRASKSIQKI